MVALAMLVGVPGAARAAQTSENVRIKTSDGVELAATISGESPLAARPTVVEFSPYGPGSATYTPPADYNSLLVQIRGTGDSDGEFDALGPRTQQDVQDVLGWACSQPWSNGSLALNGFSASAITIYNSLHLDLPCVKAALLKSGTRELYRDLLVPGGVNNIAPGTAVLLEIGGIALSQGGSRIQRDPAGQFPTLASFVQAGLADLEHPTLDDWWRERGYRGNVNHIPALVIDGFFDVESRGAFEGYGILKGDGAHMIVVGAHDGAPSGTDGGIATMNAWVDHYVRGVDNGVDREPRVRLLMSDGDREDYMAGHFVRASGDDWPLPGTTWQSLSLSAARSGSARSLNDGSLTLGSPGAATSQSYPSIPSLPTNTDVPTTAIVGAAGFNVFSTAFPISTDMTVAGALGVSYTSAPLTADVTSGGPLALDVPLSTTVPSSAIWAVVSDVSPDGTPHPLAVGRLNTDFPGVVDSESRHDPVSGDVVQPYGDYSTRSPATPGATRNYQVEFWPIGNRFRAGHRIRLDIVGAAGTSLPSAPALNTIRVGGSDGARLLFPVAPGSDLAAALP
jgi:putative CocE/NonD family hydrolase